MSLGELTEFIIKGIVSVPESVEVETIENEKTTIINITVDEKDLCKIIGRGGKVINSIRTLIREASSLRDDKFVKVEVKR